MGRKHISNGRSKGARSRWAKVREERAALLDQQLSTPIATEDTIGENTVQVGTVNENPDMPRNSSSTSESDSNDDLTCREESASDISGISPLTLSPEKMNDDDTATDHGDEEFYICETSRDLLATTFPHGNLIIEPEHFITAIRKVEQHTLACTYGGKLIFADIKYKGLSATLTFICNKELCCTTETITNESRRGGLDKLSVLGALTTGSGFANEEEKYSIMNMKYMSAPTFATCEKIIGDFLQNDVEASIKIAVEEEIQLARARDDVDIDGHFRVCVTVDGGWCKRSYGHAYNAAGGVAIIVGNASNRILYIGVKNKVCMICNAIEAGRSQHYEHNCWKNWTGASTAMESTIIVEGMQYLEDNCNLRCMRIVGDGDSNTMNKIREDISYGHQVEKVECANHACRRFRRALEKIQKATHKYADVSGRLSRKYLQSKIPRLVNGARGLIKRRAVSIHETPSTEAIKNLQEEFLNVPEHVFGNHANCGTFCKNDKQAKNGEMYDTIVSCGMMKDIKAEISRVLVKDAKTLIFNSTNNTAESYMSLLCKTIGGKRKDHAKAGGIARRANAAALVFQKPLGGAHSNTIKQISGSSPGPVYKSLVKSREEKRLSNAKQRLTYADEQRQKNAKDYIPAGGDQHYGEGAAGEDMDPETYEDKKKEHWSSISVARNDILEESTRLQAKSDKWFEERRLRISSTKFSCIFNRKKHTPCAKLVISMLYSKVAHSKAMEYGICHEVDAIKQYELDRKTQVRRCGLFVDTNNPYLCTSPDGLVGEDGLVEVKCPYLERSASGRAEFVSIASQRIIGLRYDEEGAPYIPKKHRYYYQVQGQLAITKRLWCHVIFWSRRYSEVVTVLPEDGFMDKIRPKLHLFYTECLLPEIIDQRHPHRAIREPEHIRKAIEEKECHVALKTAQKKRKRRRSESPSDSISSGEDNFHTDDNFGHDEPLPTLPTEPTASTSSSKPTNTRQRGCQEDQLTSEDDTSSQEDEEYKYEDILPRQGTSRSKRTIKRPTRYL